MLSTNYLFIWQFLFQFKVCFVDPLDMKYESPVCCEVLRYPVEFKECGHRYCFFFKLSIYLAYLNIYIFFSILGVFCRPIGHEVRMSSVLWSVALSGAIRRMRPSMLFVVSARTAQVKKMHFWFLSNEFWRDGAVHAECELFLFKTIEIMPTLTWYWNWLR